MNASSGMPPTEYRACSACAGDYEDPDRTAWTGEFPDRGDADEPRAPADEFPVQRE